MPQSLSAGFSLLGPHLNRVSQCPLSDESRKKCGQHGVINDDWVTLAGWGNPSAKVAFVGINPRLGSQRTKANRSAGERHRVRPGQSREEQAHELARAGFEDDPHFKIHHDWLQYVRTEVGDAQIPASLAEFAFFTEAAFCPTKMQPPREVVSRCFHNNTLNLLNDLNLEVIITVGAAPTEQVLLEAELITVQDNVQDFHGQMWELPSHRVLIASYQPAALERPKWKHLDRLQPAKRMVQAHRRGFRLC